MQTISGKIALTSGVFKLARYPHIEKSWLYEGVEVRLPLDSQNNRLYLLIN